MLRASPAMLVTWWSPSEGGRPDMWHCDIFHLTCVICHHITCDMCHLPSYDMWTCHHVRCEMCHVSFVIIWRFNMWHVIGQIKIKCGHLTQSCGCHWHSSPYTPGTCSCCHRTSCSSCSALWPSKNMESENIVPSPFQTVEVWKGVGTILSDSIFLEGHYAEQLLQDVWWQH